MHGKPASLQGLGVLLVGALLTPAGVRPAGAQDACPDGALPAYAHNDYANPRPLTDALSLGFRGVEADVFLIDGVLRVGHDRRQARHAGTFEALYLEPLRALVARCGRVTAASPPFLLTVEVKEHSEPAYAALVDVLSRYRELLTATPNGAGDQPSVEVVLVGWHPARDDMTRGVDSLLGLQHRLRHPRPVTRQSLGARVRLLSLDYGKTMGRPWVTDAERRHWLAALRAAKDSAPGRLVRAYNVPADANVYSSLLASGVDLIGAKRLRTTRRLLSASGGR